MSKMTYEQLQVMVGRKFVRDSLQGESVVEVLRVERANNGFTVFFRDRRAILGAIVSCYRYLGLREFQRRYPHMIEE